MMNTLLVGLVAVVDASVGAAMWAALMRLDRSIRHFEQCCATLDAIGGHR
jgi:hypothetical protein